MDQDDRAENNAAVYVDTELQLRKTRMRVEFPMFVMMMTMSLCGAAISNIILYRTCVHSLNYTTTECSVFLSLQKTNDSDALEKEVQQYATFVTMVKSVLQSIVPAILSMFLGSWSDTHGRKALIVWPLLGTALGSCLVVVYSLMDNLGPWWYIVTVVPASLCGGMTVLFTGVNCYTSDVTTSKNRTLRMTLIQAAVSLGLVVGSLSASYLLKAVGHVYLLLIAAAINVFSYAVTNISLKESLNGALPGNLCSVLDILLVKDLMRECFKRRPNNGRAQVLLLIFANSLTIFILYGSFDLEYFYTRTKLNWSMSDYTIFSAVSTTMMFLGGMLGVVILHNVSWIGDMGFILVSLVSSLADFITKALAVVGWQMYLSVGLSPFRGLAAPLVRSLITKIAPVEDIAKLFTLMSAVEALCPLLSPIIYNSLYTATLSTFPAAIYVLNIVFIVISIVMVGCAQQYRRNVTAAHQPL